MKHRAAHDRLQTQLLPAAVEDYVPPEHPVRFLDAFVAQLDLHTLGFAKAIPAHTERPPYAPGDLLRLYLYGYGQRLRSSPAGGAAVVISLRARANAAELVKSAIKVKKKPRRIA